MSKSAVIVLSGGIDSTVAGYIAREEMGKKADLYGVTFNYGQRHEKETECAKLIGRELDFVEHRFAVMSLNWLVDSSLLDKSGSRPRTTGVEDNSIPTTWVPQRNSIFLAMAFAFAETVNADHIYVGFNVRDYSGYPDCRPQFVSAIERALNLASARATDKGQLFSIETPIINWHKWQIVEKGLELGVPFGYTWSCYLGKDKACGVCDSCRIRLEAFQKLNKEDPIEYA